MHKLYKIKSSKPKLTDFHYTLVIRTTVILSYVKKSLYSKHKKKFCTI